ncbi:Type IV pilus assembly ATPase component PilU [hydrothermal vent metagenome]|uniref:Type IV pilus assembly ATPase component PilU n=1 Tax=hydrothermal vent metagenome TaxID=652676 RepID=A0A3B0XG33_9ZZZZ
MNLQPYLKLMSEQQASDMYFTTGAPVSVRIEGSVRPVGKSMLNPGMTKKLAYDLLTPTQIKDFEKNLELNLGMSYTELGRFRINIYMQRGEVSMVIRYIRADIPTIDELGLPKIYKSAIMQKKGLVLIVGATGMGKSTSLASMLDHRNMTENGHILTIEDPIEFMFRHKKCIVGQREVGLDTLSFDNALREAMREAPDVIMIGEARDKEVMEAALRYADTGHLCLTTLHATNANQTLDRLLNFFPSDAHNQVLMDLSLNLNCILAQRLVKTEEGTRIAAVEVLVNTPYISKLIREGSFNEIKDIMAKGSEAGMKTFDQSLFDLFKSRKIDLQAALANADSSSDLEWKINFGGGMKELHGKAEKHETLQLPVGPADLEG